ncbi:MAG TPA: HTTM domain-containing protein [Polyangiaceae bacterium]|nr:HTTM domain-containing protein [Polyangiaceae bacterium]
MTVADVRRRLFDSVDAAGLVFFRILFGALMCWDAGRYVLLGWVRTHYIEPELNLKFVGFEWVGTLPGPLMYAVFGIMIASSAAICVGAHYRLACVLFFLSHTYVFLVAAEYYLNHAYLISTVAFLLAFVPAHRALSVDATRIEGLHRKTVPRWAYLLPMAMMTLVYVYGAIAKMNADWIAGEPVRHWLADRARTAIEPVAALLRTEPVVMFVSINGILFDLLVVPLLLWKRTRMLAVVLSLCFHLSNHYLFNIGVFPWFSLAMTTLFFEPDWPRRIPFGMGEELGHRIDTVGPAAEDDAQAPETPPPSIPSERDQRRIAGLLAAVIVVHALLPLRHYLYEGDVAWNEAGHMFSWRMKLRNKRGRFSLRVVDKATGNQWTVYPDRQLTDRQYRKAATRPDLMLYYVHYLRDAYARDMNMDVAIYADAFVSLNYRPEQRFVDPEVDLAAEEPKIIGDNTWVTDFEDTPLPIEVPTIERGLTPISRRLQVLLSRLATI